MSEQDLLAKQRAERAAKLAQKNTPAAQPQTPTPSAPVVESSSSSSSSSSSVAAPVAAAPPPLAAVVAEVNKAPEAQASAPATEADSLEEQRRKRQEIINARLAQKTTISVAVAVTATPVATPASIPEKKPEEVVVVEKTEAVSSSAPLSSSDVEVAEEEGLDPSQLSSSDEGDQEPQRTGGFKGKNFDPNYKQKKFQQQQQQNQFQQHHQGFQQFPQGYPFDPQGYGAPPPGFYPPPHGYPYPPQFDPYYQYPPQYPEQDYSSSSSFDPSSSYPGASGPSAPSNLYQYETYEEVSAYDSEMQFQNFYGAEMMKTYRDWVNGKAKVDDVLLPFLKQMMLEGVPEQAPEKPQDFESKKTKMISNSYARLAETSTQEEFEDNITIVLNTAQAEEQEKRADNWIPSCMACSCCSGFAYNCDCVVSRNKKRCSLCRELLLASTDSETSSQPEQPDDVLEECVDLDAPEAAPVLPMVMLDNTDEKAQEDTWFPEAMACPDCNGFANRCPKRCFVSRLKNVSLIKPASPVEDA